MFQKFVPNFAHRAAPLNQSLKTEQPATLLPLNSKEPNAMKILKTAHLTPLVLAPPFSSAHLVLGTDSCNDQFGCVFLPKQLDDTKKPIGYWSRSLSNTEHRYDTTLRKSLAIVGSVLLLRPHLKKICFKIRTDHDALNWILSLTDSTVWLGRWRLRLSELDFDVVNHAGIKHQATEAFSRLNTSGKDESPLRRRHTGVCSCQFWQSVRLETYRRTRRGSCTKTTKH